LYFVAVVSCHCLDTAIAEDPLPGDDQVVGDPLPDESTSPVNVAEDETDINNAASIKAHNTTYSGLSKDSVTYKAVAAYRTNFRKQNIPADYSVWSHIGAITFFAFGAAGFAGWIAGGPVAMWKSTICCCMVVFAFFLANFFEYYSHRYKLHNPLVHTRHSHTHHRYVTSSQSSLCMMQHLRSCQL
jgi:hypothetical protein